MNSILVVGSDHAEVVSLTQALTAAGCSVHREREGRQAIAKARSVRFAAAIVDFSLPDRRGDEISDELRSIDRGVRIFLCIDLDSRALAQWAKLANATLLRRPVDETQLLTIIRNALPSLPAFHRSRSI